MLHLTGTIRLTSLVSRTLRRAAARARDLLDLKFLPRPNIFPRHQWYPESDPVSIRRALDIIGQSKTLDLVHLVQANRIRGRLHIAQSHIAAAQLAYGMNSESSAKRTGRASGSSVPSPTSSFNEYLPIITSALDRLTTSANALPSTRSDINFNRTMDRKFANDLDEASDRVLRMAEQLLVLVEVGQEESKGKGKGKESTAKATKLGGKASTKTRRKLEDEDDVVDGYKRGVIGVVDGLLEDAVGWVTSSLPSRSC